MEKYILCIDIGTSSVKTAVFNCNGEIVGISSKEYKTYFGEDGAVEQDPFDWWESIKYNIKNISEVVDMKKICAIGVDSHSTSMIPVSSNGEVLHNSLIWMDKRAKKQKKWIDENVKNLSEITGNKNDVSNLSPKILWFKENCEDLYKKTYKILNATGYIVYKFTNKFTCNISECGLSQLYDINKKEWSDELFASHKIEKNLMPSIFECSGIVGSITKETAKELGLNENISVVAGSMDVVACGLGCGVVGSGDSFITGGTATALGVCLDKQVLNQDFHIHPNIVPNTFLRVAGVDFGGGNFRWFRDKFMTEIDDKFVYEEMNKMVDSVPAGSDKLLFLPTTVGQRCPQWDSSMRGVFLGISPTHGKEHFIRAIMEGNAFSVKELIEIQELEEQKVKKVVIAGGIAKSEQWMQIFADVLGKNINISNYDEAALLGNMLNTAMGLSIIDDYDKVYEICNCNNLKFTQKTNEIYGDYYKVFKKIYPSLKESFKELDEI